PHWHRQRDTRIGRRHIDDHLDRHVFPGPKRAHDRHHREVPKYNAHESPGPGDAVDRTEHSMSTSGVKVQAFPNVLGLQPPRKKIATA
ncbi:unnamed protein product, partial [Sphacelaria rigidula]